MEKKNGDDAYSNAPDLAVKNGVISMEKLDIAGFLEQHK